MAFWQSHDDYANNDPEYTECHFRFAGQYEDKESGLYYNRFRYYDKDTGQYISPDPIGLLGGFNPYGYVHCPTGWVDPFGLSGTSTIDHIGDGRPVSGHTGYLNSPRLSRRELIDIRNELNELGINFVRNANKHLPPQARGGVDYTTGTVYVKRGATRYEAFHEMTHAKQYAAIGKEAYIALGTYARESHVFNTIIGNRTIFSSAELKHAIGYMRYLKSKYFRGAIN